MKTQVLLAVAWIVFLSVQPSNAQECEACYTEPGSPAICISQNYGVTSCIPNGQGCTTSGDCGMAGCFLAGTLVETRVGPVPIEEIIIGDEVTGAAASGEPEYAAVTKIYRTIGYEYYLINGAIRVTGSHPFRVGTRWVNAEDLAVGDMLVDEDGRSFPVDTIALIARGVRAYNIEVEGSHTFFADGVLVHNKPPEKY